jgi:hypothetical protein
MKYLLYTNDQLTGVYSNLGDAVSEEENIEIIEMSVEDLEILQRKWRDEELKNTDWIITITDHPERATNLTYRVNLRDWPSTDSFPSIRPTL